MERFHRAHALRLAVAAALGLCLSLPLAAQDMTDAGNQGDRADKAATGSMATSKAGDQRFLDKATKDNEKEVAAATLGQQKASSADVREYASHLLRDHQDLLVKLDETAVALGVSSTRRYTAMAGWGSGVSTVGQAASAAGGTSTASTVRGRGTDTTAAPAGAPGMAAQAVPAAAGNDPAIHKMAGLSGASFDRAFVDHMVVDHKKAIAEFERASKDSSLSAESRELASNALPKLRNHLAMAETLRVNLKTSAQ